MVVDSTVLDDVMSQVLVDNTGKAGAKHKEMQRIAVEGYVDAVRVSKDQLIAFMDVILFINTTTWVLNVLKN